MHIAKLSKKKRLKKASISEEKLKKYGLKAIFYCAYASYWNPKSIYKRNLGCAIERAYGPIECYERLHKEYE